MIARNYSAIWARSDPHDCVIVGQSVSCAFGQLVAGNDTRNRSGWEWVLAPIGEFSFIIAALAARSKSNERSSISGLRWRFGGDALLNPYLIGARIGGGIVRPVRAAEAGWLLWASTRNGSANFEQTRRKSMANRTRAALRHCRWH